MMGYYCCPAGVFIVGLLFLGLWIMQQAGFLEWLPNEEDKKDARNTLLVGLGLCAIGIVGTILMFPN